MVQDPSFRNKVFETSSLSSFMSDYVQHLNIVMQMVDGSEMERAFLHIKEAADRGATIYVAGNGGSAAISDHLCCDWTKGTCHAHHPAVRTHSLVANNALITALANDFGYEETFSRQLQLLAKQGDVIVLVSSSGNSPNIIQAALKARELGVTVIGFSGFDGGKLADASDISLHVPMNNYGLVEDAHQILMHVLAQYLTAQRHQTKTPAPSAHKNDSASELFELEGDASELL